jgi:hypothetical protein
MEDLNDKNDLNSMFKSLIDKSLKNMEEERDLSLERYRRQDETIISPEDFILQGKFAVDYLKVAAERSNAMIGVAKMIKDIIYKDSENSDDSLTSSGLSDELKRKISNYVRENPDK